MPKSSAIFGAAAVTVGVLGMFGAMTGYLPSMMAAIWYPQLLGAPTPAAPSESNGKVSPFSASGFWKWLTATSPSQQASNPVP
jgi:hypothetical protein